MDVVVRMSERNPAAGFDVAEWGDEAGGDPRPGGVGEGPVVAGGQGGAVPDVSVYRPWALQRWDPHADEISLHSDEACGLAELARHVHTGVHAV
ncbi:hypothetical protein AB0G12_41820 [Nonomuraea dietziae]